ncbi:hypothetical protein [Virgibacillus saliphilus]|nr:hypothetical protein [Virgibacillus sp. NKC19-3]
MASTVIGMGLSILFKRYNVDHTCKIGVSKECIEKVGETNGGYT